MWSRMLLGYSLLIVVNIVLICMKDAKGVKIVRLSVPNMVENGTEDSVLLDCEYELLPGDTSNLVVKWFLNNDPKPIYQWIPELNKKYIDVKIAHKLNRDFSVTSGNNFTKYRALNLLRPTTEFSGRYSCQVSSLASQDQKAENMIVYVPPKYFQFNFTRCQPHSTIFQCEVEGVFPIPTVMIYKVNKNNGDEIRLDTRTDVTNQANGAYRVVAHREVRNNDLRVSEFVCKLSIPKTEYEIERWLELPEDYFLNGASLPCLNVLALLNFLGMVWYMIQ